MELFHLLLHPHPWGTHTRLLRAVFSALRGHSWTRNGTFSFVSPSFFRSTDGWMRRRNIEVGEIKRRSNKKKSALSDKHVLQLYSMESLKHRRAFCIQFWFADTGDTPDSCLAQTWPLWQSAKWGRIEHLSLSLSDSDFQIHNSFKKLSLPWRFLFSLPIMHAYCRKKHNGHKEEKVNCSIINV